jgi:putative membrane protein
VLRYVIRAIITAAALGVAVWLVPGLAMTPYAEGPPLFVPGPSVETLLTYLLVAVIFGVVNTVIGNLIRIVAFPLYILTLGLVSLVVNGSMLLIVNAISNWLGFGLSVDGFWWGVLGALVLSLSSWLIGLIFRPFIQAAVGPAAG